MSATLLRVGAGVLAATALGACSLVVDVPADCTDADCAPYVCSADGVACEAACDSDDGCVAGFVCDRAGGVCEPAGCEPRGERVVLSEVPTRIDELDVVAASDPEQLVLLIGNQDGLGFLRFDMSGARVGDPIDETLGSLPVAGANEDRSPFEPSLERTTTDEGAELLLFAWRAHRGGLDRIETTTFDPDAPSIPSVEQPYTARQRTLLNVPGSALTPAGPRAFWRETVGQGSTLYSIPVDNPSIGERALTAEDESVGHVSVAPLAERALVVASTSSDGFERLDVYVVDENGVAVGKGRLQAEQPAQSVAFPTLAVAASAERWFALWGVETENTTYRGAVLEPGDLAGLAGDSAVAVPSFAVGRSLTDVVDANAAWRGDQLFVVWDATLQGREDIWVTRYTSTGEARFAPFPVTGGNANAVDGVYVFPSVAGVDVVWRERRDDVDEISLQRYACLP